MANILDPFGTGRLGGFPTRPPGHPAIPPVGHPAPLMPGNPGSPPPTQHFPQPAPTQGTPGGRAPMPTAPTANPAVDPRSYVLPGMADIFTPDMKGWLATIEPGSYQFNSLPPMQKAWITGFRGAQAPTPVVPPGTPAPPNIHGPHPAPPIDHSGVTPHPIGGGNVVNETDPVKQNPYATSPVNTVNVNQPAPHDPTYNAGNLATHLASSYHVLNNHPNDGAYLPTNMRRLSKYKPNVAGLTQFLLGH